MADNKSKYPKSQGKSSERREKVGLIISVVSVFILFCLLTRAIVLGIIGEFVFRAFSGLIGCLSYPVCLFFLMFGIMRSQSVSVRLKKRSVVCWSVILFCVIQIVQIATTAEGINTLSYWEYLGNVFSTDMSAGGIFSALFAYLIAKGLSFVGAYIVLSLSIVCCLLLVSSVSKGMFDKASDNKIKKRISKQSEGDSLIGDGSALFVNSIKEESEENNFKPSYIEDIATTQIQKTTSNRNEYSEIDEYNKNRVDEYWNQLTTRKSVHRALFEENTEAYEKFRPQVSSYNISQRSFQSEEVKREEIEREELKPTVSFGFTGQYPHKDVSNSFVAGAIINGDEASKKLAEENNYLIQKQKSIQEAKLNDVPLVEEKTEKSQASSTFDFSSLPPIVNGESFVSSGGEKEVKPAEIKIDRPVKPVEVKPIEPIRKVEQISTPNQNPIINASTYRSSTEYEESDKIYVGYGEKITQAESKDEKKSIFDTDLSPIPPIRAQAPEYYNEENTLGEEYDENDDVLSDELVEDQEDQDDDFVAPKLEEQVAPEFENQDDIVQDDIVAGEAQEDDDGEAQQHKDTEFTMQSEEICDSCDDYVELDEEQAEMVESVYSDSELQEEESEVDEAEQEEIDEPTRDDIETEDEIVSEDVFEDESYEESVEGEIVYDSSMFDFEEQEQDVEPDEQPALPTMEEIERIRAEERSESFIKNTQSFRIIEEVEDLSENKNQSSEEINDYYAQMVHTPDEDYSSDDFVPDLKKTPAKTYTSPKTGKIIGKQIGMEDYVKAEEEKKEPPKPKIIRPYTYPTAGLLTSESTPLVVDEDEKREKVEVLEACLENLEIPAKVIGVTKGPAVTRYELDMPQGMRVGKIESVSPDIKYNLACVGEIRIQTPIPGKRAVGIEVPNDKVALVGLKDIIESQKFLESPSPVTVALGKDIQGNIVTSRLDKLPHLLIAGTTGSGKSACLNSLIISLIYKSSPQDVKIILIDPKRVEFTAYNGIPHMLIPEAITDVNQAIKALAWLRDEMNRRYSLFSDKRVKKIDEYRSLPEVKDGTAEPMPYIVFIVDEFADLMLSGSDKRKALENHIMSIAGKARAAGIHLVLATQRPSKDVVTGTLKANLPAKICFKVTNRINSQVVIDRPGAESLVGMGDMLYMDSSAPEPIRVQGAFVDNDEVQAITDYVRENNDKDFSEEFKNAISEPPPEESHGGEGGEDDGERGLLDGYDKDIEMVARHILRGGNVSSSMIQRRFSMGYVRAGKIVDQLEELGFISPLSVSNKREVLITPEKFREVFGKNPEDE